MFVNASKIDGNRYDVPLKVVASKYVNTPSINTQNKLERQPDNDSFGSMIKGSLPFLTIFGIANFRKQMGGLRFLQLLTHPIKWIQTTGSAITKNVSKAVTLLKPSGNWKLSQYMAKAFKGFSGNGGNISKAWNFLKVGGFKGWAIFGAIFELPELLMTGSKHGFASTNMIKQIGRSAVNVATSAVSWIGGAALGTGIGGFVGGTIGSLFGPAGTVIGAAIGKFAGGFLGGMTGNHFAGKATKAILGENESAKPSKAELAQAQAQTNARNFVFLK